MAVITQNYDIDLKATGEYPVVKMSQFDTGSRTIVFTVYDGHDLAHIDGMVARVDGTRSDGVEFSSSCTVGKGSKVSFTISQEMTKHAGKHAAELVIFDGSGNPIGTQNFIIDVEAAPMVRDSAASADDRTLYDQYTDSVESKFDSLSSSLTNALAAKTDALTKTVQDIDALLGGSSTARTIINQDVTVNGSWLVHVTLVYDPMSGMVALNVNSESALGGVAAGVIKDFKLVDIPADYLPEADKYTGNEQLYRIAWDGYKAQGASDDWGVDYLINPGGSLFLRVLAAAGAGETYGVGCSGTWFARGGRYMGVTPIPTGSNTVTIGTTTTVEPGTQASVVNSGTAKDVVLDFAIPRGGDGTGSSYTLPAATTSTLGGVKVGSHLSITEDGTLSTDPTASFAGTGAASIAISTQGDAESTATAAIAIGKNAKSGDTNSAGTAAIAIGRDSNSQATNNIAIGTGALAYDENNGDKTPAGVPSSGVGTVGTIAIGNSSEAWDFSVALGCEAKAEEGTALGYRAVCAGGNSNSSVALGASSYANEEYVVSVGNEPAGIKRRVINVADPTGAQDAATKGYVDSQVASGGYTLPAATANTLGGVKVGAGLTVGSDGTISAATYGAFSYSYTRIAIGLTDPTGLLCLGADSASFIAKPLGPDSQRFGLGLKAATATTLGGVKVGAGINVTSDGTIDVQALVDRIAALESKVAALESK